MSKLSLNPNQFAQTALIGMAAEQTIDTVTCQINPNTTAAYICAGSAVKLVANSGPEKVVDVTTDDTDGPVYGIIAYNPRINTYAASDRCEVHTELNVVYMKSSAAIDRGVRVSVTNPTASTDDPTVAGDSTALHYTLGVAETQVSGSGQLIKIRVRPAQNITVSNPTTTVSAISA